MKGTGSGMTVSGVARFSDAEGGQSQWPPLTEITNLHNYLLNFLIFWFTCILQYGPLQEKRCKYGNQTKEGARSYKKKMDNFKSFKSELKFFLLNHALFTGCIYVVLNVCGL